MKYKANDIGPAGRDVEVAVTESWLNAELPDLGAKPTAAQGLVLKGRIEPSGTDFLLRGSLRGALETTCVRCLEPAILSVNAPVTVCFVDKEQGEAAGASEDDLDAPDVIGFEDGVIDLTEELRDEISLALPQSPLCKEDCAGLCPVCGGNRNLTPCDCEDKQRVANSKLGALSKLKI